VSPSAPPIPPAVWERICRFLADGHTGQVILDVKDGRILAYKVTEWGRVQSPTPARKSQKG
jgi:hypothetical protein